MKEKEFEKYKLIVIPGGTDVRGDDTLEALENEVTLSGNCILQYDKKKNLTFAYLLNEDEIPCNETSLGAVNAVFGIENNSETEVSVYYIKECIPRGYKAEITGKGDEYELFINFVPEKMVQLAASTVDIEDLKKNIVDQGIWTQEELDERLEALENWGIEDYVVEMLLKKAKKFPVTERKPDVLFANYEGIMNKILIGVALRIPIFSRGNKGTGKNTAFRSAAWVAGLPFGEISPNKNSDNETLFGGKTTMPPEISRIPQDEQRKMAQAYMKYMRGSKLTNDEIILACDWERVKSGAPAVQIMAEESQIVSVTKNGGALHLNEFDRLDANSASFFNPYGDGSKFIDIPYHGRMEINPDCQIFASCNPGYAGAQKTNDATADRFIFVNFPNPNESQIEDIFIASAGEFYNTFKDSKGKCTYIKRGATAYVKMLQAVTERKVSNDKCLSIRSFVNAFNIVLLSKGTMKLKDAVKMTVLEHCDDSDKIALNRIVEEIGI